MPGARQGTAVTPAHLALQRFGRDENIVIEPERFRCLPTPTGCVCRAGDDVVEFDREWAVLRADVRDTPRVGKVRLVLLLGLGLIVVVNVSQVFSLLGFLLSLSIGAMRGALPPPVPIVVTGLFAMVVARWLDAALITLQATLFAEALQRVVSVRLVLPAGSGERTLLRLAQRSLAALLVVALLLDVSTQALARHGWALTAAWAIVTIGLMVVLQVMGRQTRVGFSIPPMPQSGPWPALVSSALHGLRYAVLATLLWDALVIGGGLDAIYDRWPVRLPTPGELKDAMLGLAVIVGVIRSKLEAERWPTAVALLAGFVAEKAFGLPGKLLASFIVVVLTVRVFWKAEVKKAFRVGLRFEFGAALGRIVGRLVAGLFLGTVALPLGESLGEQIAAATAFRQPPETPAGPP